MTRLLALMAALTVIGALLGADALARAAASSPAAAWARPVVAAALIAGAVLYLRKESSP